MSELGEALRELDRSWTREQLREMGPEKAYRRAVRRDNKLTFLEDLAKFTVGYDAARARDTAMVEWIEAEMAKDTGR